MRVALVLLLALSLGGCALQPTYPDDIGGMLWRCAVGIGPCT